jgi:hypothetical protein
MRQHALNRSGFGRDLSEGSGALAEAVPPPQAARHRRTGARPCVRTRPGRESASVNDRTASAVAPSLVDVPLTLLATIQVARGVLRGQPQPRGTSVEPGCCSGHSPSLGSPPEGGRWPSGGLTGNGIGNHPSLSLLGDLATKAQVRGSRSQHSEATNEGISATWTCSLPRRP